VTIESTQGAAGQPSRLTIHEPSCRSFQNVVELVGRRWTSAILLAGQRGARRFGEYRLSVPGISDRLLTQRLKELQAEGLIARKVIPSTPVQVLYELSAEGQELMSVLQPLVDWSYRRSASGRDASAALD
jgi:DNA-binding HxlR family transcriptional regulator